MNSVFLFKYTNVTCPTLFNFLIVNKYNIIKGMQKGVSIDASLYWEAERVAQQRINDWSRLAL